MLDSVSFTGNPQDSFHHVPRLINVVMIGKESCESSYFHHMSRGLTKNLVCGKKKKKERAGPHHLSSAGANEVVLLPDGKNK